MKYKIINSGSDGNAVVIENEILIDCGVSFKKLLDNYKSLKIVLLTHIHSDHLNKRTLGMLARERPMLRVGCCDWLYSAVSSCGVSQQRIDIFKPGKSYDYGLFQVEPVKLSHNVENCGYKIMIGEQKLFYATDTGNLDNVEANGYDLYMVEANYTDEEMAERIKKKEKNGEYPYEYEVMQNHLSKTKCDNFIYKNITNGEYVYMHQHKGGDNHDDTRADSEL